MKSLKLLKISMKGGPIFNGLNKIKEAGAATPTSLAKQTSTMIVHQNQNSIVLKALLSGPKTSIDLREGLGILAPSARIATLRKSFKIITIKVTVCHKGIWHRNIAKYALIQGHSH